MPDRFRSVHIQYSKAVHALEDHELDFSSTKQAKLRVELKRGKERAKLELSQFMLQLELKWAKEWAKLELLKRWANLNRVVFTIQAWAWVENLVRFSLTHFPFCTSLKEGDPWCNSKVSQLQPRGYGSKPWKPPLCLRKGLCTSNPPQTLQQEELVHWVALTSLESLRSGRAQAGTWASSFIINPK